MMLAASKYLPNVWGAGLAHSGHRRADKHDTAVYSNTHDSSRLWCNSARWPCHASCVYRCRSCIAGTTGCQKAGGNANRSSLHISMKLFRRWLQAGLRRCCPCGNNRFQPSRGFRKRHFKCAVPATPKRPGPYVRTITWLSLFVT